MPEETKPTAEGLAGSGLPGADNGQSLKVDAAALAVAHGGNRGGKARADGLVPGSPEAIAADRKRDAERKRIARAGAATPSLPSLPPPLPSRVDRPVSPGGDAPRQLWNPQHVRPVVRAILKSFEKVKVRVFLAKAREILAVEDDPEDEAFLAEVEKDARWDSEALADLEAAGAEWGAKLLDRMGVPAGSQAGLRTFAAIVRLVVQDVLGWLKLEDMLDKAKRAKTDKKPATPDGGAK